MILKWIECIVPFQKRNAFSQAQAKWGQLKRIDGFIGQIGGWEKTDARKAFILAFWTDLASYQSFMNNEHERFVQENQQESTYDFISVSLYSNEGQVNVRPFLERGEMVCYSGEYMDKALKFNSLLAHDSSIYISAVEECNKCKDIIELEKEWRVTQSQKEG